MSTNTTSTKDTPPYQGPFTCGANKLSKPLNDSTTAALDIFHSSNLATDNSKQYVTHLSLLNPFREVMTHNSENSKETSDDVSLTALNIFHSSNLLNPFIFNNEDDANDDECAISSQLGSTIFFQTIVSKQDRFLTPNALSDWTKTQDLHHLYKAIRSKAKTLLSLNTEPPTYNSELLNAQWMQVKSLAQELISTHYVFLHACDHSNAISQDLMTYLNPTIAFPGFSSSWNERKTLRAPSVKKKFQNIQQYRESDIAKSINNCCDYTVSDHTYSADLLSCDAYFDNQEDGESAHSIFGSSMNIRNGSNFYQKILKDYFKNRKIQEFAKWNISSINQPFFRRVLVIAIAKTTLQNASTNYVFKSHPYGKMCTHFGASHLEFLNELEKNNLGHGTPCENDDENNEPQYRILTGNLEEDSTKKIFTLDSFVIKNKEQHDEQFWPLALLLKQCQRLESLTTETPKELVLSILLRTRLTLPEDNFYDDEENYLEGIVEILNSKKHIFAKHKEYLTENLPEPLLQDLKKLELFTITPKVIYQLSSLSQTHF